MIETLLQALESRGDEPAIEGLAPDAKRTWRQSGRTLLERAGGWQRTLASRGARPGDRVGLDLERGPDLLAAHVAVLALGACAVPLNPALRPTERERVLARADLRVLLDANERPAGAGKLALRAAPAGSPALLIFTSGTTGEPKGVPHTLAGLESNLAGLAQAWGLRAGEPLLHVLPAHHVHGLVLALYGSARMGMPILLAPRFEPASCLEALARHAAGVLMGVPTMYHRLAQLGDPLPSLPHLRLLVSGSAPLAPEDFERCRERLGQAPLERYGLTETLIVTSNPLHGERRAGTVGRPLPDTEVRLAEDGEILVRGPAVTPGYWRAPDITAESLEDGFFRTGDLGRHEDAGYLVIAGRKKELIIVGGSNVLPGEVEHALAGAPGVDELAAVGWPDPDRGEIVALFVVLQPGAAASATERELRLRAERELARYKQPRRYAFLEALPRNAMGKIDRRALRALG